MKPRPGGASGVAASSSWWRLLVLYVAFVLAVDILAWLRLLPRGLARLPGFDLLAHFALIGLAGYLLHRALGRRTVRALGVSLPLGPLLVAGLAVLDEGLQLLAPWRSASLADLGANLAGLACCYGLDRIWLRRRARLTRRRQARNRSV